MSMKDQIIQKIHVANDDLVVLHEKLNEVLDVLKLHLDLPSIESAHEKLESVILLTNESLHSLKQAEGELK